MMSRAFTAIAASVLSATLLADIVHHAKDGNAIIYPNVTSNAVDMDIHQAFICGSSSNTFKKLDINAAQAMAGTMDALVQRMIYGTKASWTFVQTNEYHGIEIPMDDNVTIHSDIWGAGKRNLGRTLKISRIYDEAPAEIISSSEHFFNATSEDLTDFGSGPFLWSSKLLYSENTIGPCPKYSTSFSEFLGGLESPGPRGLLFLTSRSMGAIKLFARS